MAVIIISFLFGVATTLLVEYTIITYYQERHPLFNF